MDEKLVLSSGVEVSGVPDVVKILPMGLVKSQKGDFVVDNESFESIERIFKTRGIDIVIDYEHQTLEDVQAPASGWIKSLFIQDGAIACKVEWTPKAQEYLKNKEYKYLSPVVVVRKRDGKAVALSSVGLTNTPAIDGMYSIVNSNKFHIGDDSVDFLKKMAAALGLSENATEEEVVAAVAELNKKKEDGEVKTEEQDTVANKVIGGLVGVNSGKTEDIVAAILALKNNKDGFVSVAEFNSLKEKLEKKETEDIVVKALKDGKLMPVQKEWAVEYALKDREGFKRFIDQAPRIVPLGEISIDTFEDKKTSSEETMKVCKMLNVSAEDLEKYGKGGVR